MGAKVWGVNPESVDRAKNKSVTHVATTSKRISFKEVRLRPKKERSVDIEREPGGDEKEEHAGLGTDGVERGFSAMGGRDHESMEGDEGDDALEYVDLPTSMISTTPIDPSPSILRTLNEGEDHPAATTLLHMDKGKRTTGESVVAGEVEETVDPAMQIDRLTGILPPLARVPRKRKASRSKKGKEKAGDDQMDMTEG